jgi:Carboxypeptidase regulatory-like domain
MSLLAGALHCYLSTVRKGLIVCACLGSCLFAVSALAQKSAIDGNASNPNGAPLKSAQVRIAPEKGKGATVTVNTDSKGHFVADGLAPGVYTVTITLNGALKWSAAHVKTTSGQVVHLTLGGKQVAVTTSAAGAKPKKHLVWVPEQTGSHLGGHWEDEPDRGPIAGSVDTMSTEQLRRMQNVPPPMPAGGGR